MKDYYYLLGVTPKSSKEEIKLAFRNLSKKFHPDFNPGQEAFYTERFRELKEAYDYLINHAEDNSTSGENEQSYKYSDNSDLQPEIVYFQSDRYEVGINERFNVSWEVKNVKNVSINNFENLPAKGEKSIFVDRATKNFVLDLIATNGKHSSVRKIVVKVGNSTSVKILPLLGLALFLVLVTLILVNLKKEPSSDSLPNENITSELTTPAYTPSEVAQATVDSNRLDYSTNIGDDSKNTAIADGVNENEGFANTNTTNQSSTTYKNEENASIPFQSICASTIRKFVTSEDSRNLEDILSCISPEIRRYWNVRNPSQSQLEKIYRDSWSRNYSSSNYITSLDSINENTIDMSTTYTYKKNLEDENSVVNSVIRFEFDNEGKIIYVDKIE